MLIDSKHVLAMGGLATVMLLMSSAAVAGSNQQSIPVSGSGMDLAATRSFTRRRAPRPE